MGQFLFANTLSMLSRTVVQRQTNKGYKGKDKSTLCPSNYDKFCTLSAIPYSTMDIYCSSGRIALHTEVPISSNAATRVIARLTA